MDLPLPVLPTWFWLLALAALALAWWWARTAIARGNAQRGRVARRAEVAAERLLERLGFVVEDRQVHGTFDLLVDGAPVEVSCRADLVVRRRRRRFIAEVKTGRGADPAHPDTRRQLLEYQLAFAVDGVLLVDMEGRRVMEVGFPVLR